MQGVFLDLESVNHLDLDLEPLSLVLPRWRFYDSTTPDDIAEKISNVEIIVTNKVVLDETALNLANKLKLISVAATGTNNIDLDAAKKKKITVCNVRGYATPSVVQHVFSLVLSFVTKSEEYRKSIEQGDWQKSNQFSLLDHSITELSGKNFGVIGYGELGQAVARVASAFGMNVLVAERRDRENKLPRANRVSFYDCLKNADVLSLHCPLNENTQGLIGAAEFQVMKSTLILINTARGGIVDESALAQALKNNQIAGAGIDVLTQEPPDNSNPLLDITIPNLRITPHIAWASVESRQRLINEIAQNIQSFILGQSRNSVI